MLYSELDVVNQCLSTMGESRLSSVDDGHPAVDDIKEVLYRNSRVIQGRGWWYNREVTTLVPDTLGNVYIPNDAVNVRENLCSVPRYVPRGNRLYDTISNTFTIANDVEVTYNKVLPFTDVPDEVATVIALQTVYDWQLAYVSESAKTGRLANDLEQVRMALRRVDINNSKYNLLNNGGIGLRRGRIYRI